MGEYIGSIAGFLTTCAFFPQVLRTVRTKSAKDLSASWLVMMAAGILLWVIYGIYISSTPIIAANVVTFICILALAWIKFFVKE